MKRQPGLAIPNQKARVGMGETATPLRLNKGEKRPGVGERREGNTESRPKPGSAPIPVTGPKPGAERLDGLFHLKVVLLSPIVIPRLKVILFILRVVFRISTHLPHLVSFDSPIYLMSSGKNPVYAKNRTCGGAKPAGQGRAGGRESGPNAKKPLRFGPSAKAFYGSQFFRSLFSISRAIYG